MRINYKKMFNGFSLMLLTSCGLNLQAKRYWFSNHFDSSFFDELHYIHERLSQDLNQMESYFSNTFGKADNQIDKEQKNKLKESQQILEEIKPEITKESNGNIEIKIPLKNISKKTVEDIVLQDNILKGILESNYGKIEFYITDKSIKLVRKLELKEHKEESNYENQEQKDDKNNVQSFYAYQYSYGSSNVYSLPLIVDLATAEASVKDDNLIIKLSPKNYSKIKVHHS